MIHPKRVMARFRLQPKKSLGQNFLFDYNVLDRIAGVAGLTAGDQVLEIGPGLGSLTRVLAQRAGRVVAVELDQRLMPILESELEECRNVSLVHGDILELDPAAWFDRPYKVVANVPYYITGAILRHLLTSLPLPSVLVMTVQKEVAERMVAVPPKMNLLSVSIGYRGEAAVVMSVSAGSFWPRPDVDSAVVRVELSPGKQPADPQVDEQFFRVVRAGFSQKRKQLKNALLSGGYLRHDVTLALQRAGIDGRRRAETLEIDEWRSLSEVLAAAVFNAA